LQWDLSGPPTKPVPGGRVLGGSQVQPGQYRVVLTADKDESARPLTVELVPNAAKDLVSTDAEEQETEEAKLKRKTRRQVED
jgi:hypothetical protein